MIALGICFEKLKYEFSIQFSIQTLNSSNPRLSHYTVVGNAAHRSRKQACFVKARQADWRKTPSHTKQRYGHIVEKGRREQEPVAAIQYSAVARKE